MKYRKKPIVIEAVQFTVDLLDNRPGCPEWIQEAFKKAVDEPGTMYLCPLSAKPTLVINTLEGNMSANLNDWIIQGIQGELYPCKPDIFDATYEAVT